MRAGSIVSEAAATSRRAIAFALAGAALIVAALIVERGLYQADQAAARRELLAAHSAVGMLILSDEQLTMSANLAVATGEDRWIQRYEEIIPVIDASLEAAFALAPQAVAERLRRDTFVVNDELVALERRAFETAQDGDFDGARAILDSQQYADHKATLAAGGGALLNAVIGGVEGEIAARQTRATIMVVAIILASMVGGVALWRHLTRSLGRSEAALSEAEDVIRKLANTDMLTGLANRRAFVEELKSAVERMRAVNNPDTCVAALMVDLDRFKPINDRYGHVTGDLLLKEIASRLSNALGPTDFAARIGGDEFIVLSELPDGDAAPHRLAERIIAKLSETVTLDGLSVRVGATIGIACCPDHARDAQELLRMADVALYRAKAEGRGRAVTFQRFMDADLDLHAQLQDDLLGAIRGGAIVPYFQPLIGLQSGRVIGFEVLSRWNDPERGLLEPSEFIPLAEQFGLINDLTFALMREACLAAKELPGDIKIAVNISPQQIEDEWLAQKIMGVLAEVGFPPGRLEIELTETALVNDLAAAKRVITSLKALGVSVALDDFGVGYSSLCYLSELPFDKIKIDRSFVSSMRERPESAKIVSAIVGLGVSLGVPTVAEGVEDETEEKILRDLGCTAAQGWLYSKAVPADEAIALVKRAIAEVDPQSALAPQDNVEPLRIRRA